ncbi:MAG TPA: phospho-N-acetylmuramoyl-pentapeptide-transferase [bacterium]|nr:phospho-N-acetylmuramoyl-pentapeptide-transferase [bacterium]
MLDFYIIRVLLLSAGAFIFTMAWTPLLTNFLYRHKLGKTIRNSGDTPIFSQLHAAKSGTPTMGGVLIWVTTLLFALGLSLAAKIWPDTWISQMNFLSRSQTYLPLGILVASALVGLFDDWLDVRGKGIKGGGGLSVKVRFLIYALIALVGALWFYFKLDWDVFHIPFLGNFSLGWWYIPVFIFVIIGTAFSVNETDGLDGLAGGTLLSSFMLYGAITFLIGRYDLAAFCAVICGALLAFLWFNITPARFYMGDTGSMSMGICLGVIAMLTNTALILPFIGFIFVLETVSVIIQVTSKKLRHGRKVFLSAPIHHHFEAKGWSESKIVMRFWVIAAVSGDIGVCLLLLDHTM